MSNPKFLVFKLKDLKIPLLIVLVAILLLVFLLFRNKASAQTFAPSDTYQDGQYIAGISLADTSVDLIVQVTDGQITSISLDGLSDDSSALYNDLLSGIDYVNTYVTATQSIELPSNTSTSAATNMLMDAVKVALSDDKNAQILSTYEKLDVSDDIFVDEFSEEDFTQNTTVSETLDTPDTNTDTASSSNNIHPSILEEDFIQ